MHNPEVGNGSEAIDNVSKILILITRKHKGGRVEIKEKLIIG